MARVFGLFFLFVTLVTGFTHSFVPQKSVPVLSKTNTLLFRTHQSSSSYSLPLAIRGGGDDDDGTTASSISTCIQAKSGQVAALVSSSLASGPWGVVALWGVASSVVVPLTIYRQAFSFSVGYGFSVFAMAACLLASFSPIVWTSSSYMLTLTAAFYGFRLGSFLAIRNVVNKSKGREMKNFDKTPRLKRIPFATGVALFYAFMMTPALYALRAPAVSGTVASKIAYSGVGVAIFGALLEAIADWHKLFVKQKYGAGNTDIFVGPTGGVYRICRHPNYLGEVVFWLGLLIGGAPSFGKSATAWICSLFGFYGILSIMRNATSRLDKKQQEKYKGQDAYDLWTEQVKAPLVPFVDGAKD